MITGNEPISPVYDADKRLIQDNEENANWMSATKPCIGLTKREYFAPMALQGLCNGSSSQYHKLVAEQAVILADHLITELNKQP